MWGHINLSQYIATKLGEVINLMNHQKLIKLSTIDMVVGQNGQNRVRYIQRGYIQREEEVRGIG
jgi:hypothetical protein